MVENYMKDIKESIYHGSVVSVLAIGYTMLGKTLIKMSPPSLSKFVRFYKGLSNQAKKVPNNI